MFDFGCPQVVSAWASVATVVVGVLTIGALFIIAEKTAKKTTKEIREDQKRLLRQQTIADVSQYLWGATKYGRQYRCGEHNVKLIQALNRALVVFAGTSAHCPLLKAVESKDSPNIQALIDEMAHAAGLPKPQLPKAVFSPHEDVASQRYCSSDCRKTMKKD